MLSADELLVQRVRAGDGDAWNELIARFEGRLLAFVEGRLRDRSAGEDIVQETFIGFLTFGIGVMTNGMTMSPFAGIQGAGREAFPP